jgi:hypothetical protein
MSLKVIYLLVHPLHDLFIFNPVNCPLTEYRGLVINTPPLVRFQVLTAASMKMIAFCDRALYSFEVVRRYRDAYYTVGAMSDGEITHLCNVGPLRDYTVLNSTPGPYSGVPGFIYGAGDQLS